MNVLSTVRGSKWPRLKMRYSLRFSGVPK